MASMSIYDENFEPYDLSPFESPVYRIPRELWDIIFVATLPDQPTFDHTFEPNESALRDPRLAPISLMSVCRTWRFIACSMPELWATCWLNFINPEHNTVWLKRAGSKHMVRLYGRVHKDVEEKLDWVPLFMSILPFQERWESLELGTGSCLMQLNSIIPRINAPALKKFRMLTGTLPFWVYPFLQSVPNIQEIGIDGLSGTLSRTSIVDGVAGQNLLLSKLKLHLAIAPEQVIQILSALPQLQHLDIYLIDDFDFHPDVVTHFNLESLHIQGRIEELEILDNLTRPSLFSIRLQHDLLPISLSNLILRSKCCIIELSLRGIPLEEPTYKLRTDLVWRSVETLEASEIPLIDGDALATLVDFLKDLQNLPHLMRLSLLDLTFMNIYEYCGGAVADVLISRCQPRTCRCADCEFVPSLDKFWLKYLSINGLEEEMHSLDVAMLVSLPENRAENSEDATTILELVLYGWRQYSHDPDYFRVVHPLRILVV